MRYESFINYDNHRIEFCRHDLGIEHRFYVTFDFIRKTSNEKLSQLFKDRLEQENIVIESRLTSN